MGHFRAMTEDPHFRQEEEPDKGASGGRDSEAFKAVCDKLGLTAALLPARLQDDRPEDRTAALAESLHADRKALLAEADCLDEREAGVLAPTLATFRSNSIPQRDIKTVIEQLLMIKRLRCAYRHAPGVKSPDTLRQRVRSLSLREEGSRFTEIYTVAQASGVFRVSVLERLRELAEDSERLRRIVFEKRRAAGEEARRRADARS